MENEVDMVLTQSFKDHIKAKIKSDPEFRQALIQEAVQTLIEGDVGTARAVLRDFINATIGFPALAKATGIPPNLTASKSFPAHVSRDWSCAAWTSRQFADESCDQSPAHGCD